jgi:hypothetical protein
MTKQWDDERLNAAQSATDRLFAAQSQITAEIRSIMEKKRSGADAPADEDRLRELRNQWVILALEVTDMGHRLLDGAPLPPENLQ